MTFIATPQPVSQPPRVVLDYTLDNPGSIVSYEVLRNGETLRFDVVPSGDQIILFDYEAQYGSPLNYEISGTYLPDALPDWTESWASLAAWSGSTGSYSVSGGKARSSVLNAAIVRSTSGTIEKIQVTDPSFVRIELLTAADVVVASIKVGSDITLTGTTSTSTAGQGSFEATLVNGVVRASALNSSWSLSRAYTGVPTKVRVVALGISYQQSLAFGTTGEPIAAHVDSGGNIFVIDKTNGRLRKYSSAGAPLLNFIAGSIPQDVTTDGSGNIYVTSYGDSTVRKYNSAGVQTASFAVGFKAVGIDLDSGGNLILADFNGDQIRKFTSAGVEVVTGGFPIAFPGGRSPYGIDVDGSNNIFATCANDAPSGGGGVYKFNSSGSLLLVIGSAFATGIAVDTSGNVFVSDAFGAKAVKKFNSAGTLLTTVPLGNSAYGVAVDSAGSIYATQSTTNSIRKFASVTPSVGAIAPTLQAGGLANFSESVSTVLDVVDAWMIHPFNTALSLDIGMDTGCASEGIEVSPETKRTSVSQTRSVLLDPVGRRRWIAITQQDRKIGTWDLVLLTESYADRDAIISFLAADVPFLLRSPASFEWDLPDDWYSVQNVNEDREMYQMIPGPCGHPYHMLTLPLYPVDPPVEPVPSAWTYGQGFLTYQSYADALAAEATYLDRLTGPSV